MLVIGCAKYYPRTFSAHLKQQLRFIYLDHRGFGLAPSRQLATEDYTLDKIITDIEQVRKSLDLQQIMILGHSGHAYMALEYAKKYPSHVSHLIMLGITPDLSAATHQAIEQYWQDSVSPQRKLALKNAQTKLTDEMLAKLPPSERFIKQYTRDAARLWYDYNFDCSSLWEDVTINMEIFDHIWGSVFRDIDITQGLDQLNIPVFLGLGRYDFITPYCLWNQVRQHFKHLTLRVFEKSGHTPQYEEPELFASELLGWMANS